jgi:GR25 family glycosyltransferase involved in LPS biosynthesis
MDFYIIRIKGNEYSEKAAQRCFDSLKKFYPDYPFKEERVFFDAITPKDNPQKILEEYGVKNLRGFVEPYSRWDNVISAFTSHFLIWQRLKGKKKAFIFEHDAVLVDALPLVMKKQYTSDSENSPYTLKMEIHESIKFYNINIMNIGHPSYGKYNTPTNIGPNPLVSKRYFPGAHAYYVSSEGARELIDVAKREAGPTDVFINYKRFPKLYEWYPWCAIAKDNFSTIQNVNGCQAKHGYNPERYKLVQVR